MLTPIRWGGSGSDVATFSNATRRLATACPSSAWTPRSWRCTPGCSAGSSRVCRRRSSPRTGAADARALLAPTGTVERVDDGFRLSGRWEWATGIMHAEWVMVAAMEAERGPRFCVVPRADVEVEDVWHVAGMAATGSNAIVARDVFVPAHRTLEIRRIHTGETPGEALHAGTNVGWPMAATLVLVAATPALGAAEGALDAFTERMREKVQAYSGQKHAEIPATHFRLGEGIATANAARLVWRDAIATLDRIGPLGAAAPSEERAAIRLAAAHVVRLANTVADGLARPPARARHSSRRRFSAICATSR